MIQESGEGGGTWFVLVMVIGHSLSRVFDYEYE